jgi:predicted hydrocarbon binding protein
MFREERTEYQFKWKDLGNIEEGRPHLGSQMPVAIYRLMQYTLRDVLIKQFGVEKADKLLYDAGWLAGTEFCKNTLDIDKDIDGFIADLKERLLDFNIGVLQVERINLDKAELIITIAEDLDCSGLPMSEETICTYDEGFIAGILYVYTGKAFDVKEIDCWASGERTCRFRATSDLKKSA